MEEADLFDHVIPLLADIPLTLRLDTSHLTLRKRPLTLRLGASALTLRLDVSSLTLRLGVWRIVSPCKVVPDMDWEFPRQSDHPLPRLCLQMPSSH